MLRVGPSRLERRGANRHLRCCLLPLKGPWMRCNPLRLGSRVFASSCDVFAWCTWAIAYPKILCPLWTSLYLRMLSCFRDGVRNLPAWHSLTCRGFSHEFVLETSNTTTTPVARRSQSQTAVQGTVFPGIFQPFPLQSGHNHRDFLSRT